MSKSIRESYASATHASNLDVKARQKGAADYLIASARTPSRMAYLLARLQAEWDGAAKKPVMSDADFVLLVMNLKTLGQTIHAAEVWAARKGLQAPVESARKAVSHWFDSTCRPCEGRGYRLVTAAARPTLGEQCGLCGGSGKARTAMKLPWCWTCSAFARRWTRGRCRNRLPMCKEQIMYSEITDVSKEAKEALDLIEDLLSWRPIETAPKNRVLLLYGPDGYHLGISLRNGCKNLDGLNIHVTHWMRVIAPPLEYGE